jgi:2-keto-myo-inositol isomerase
MFNVGVQEEAKRGKTIRSGYRQPFRLSKRAMKANKISRREALTGAGLLVGTAVIRPQSELLAEPASSSAQTPFPPFQYCLNTATIRGHKLGIVKEIEVIAQAGYNAIEPWVDSITDYTRNGGSLPELKKRISDAGLTVEGAIGFPEWVVDDDIRRGKGLERAKQEMDMVAQIGGKRFASPPAGATGLPKLELMRLAERYRALLELGEQLGVVPELEVWGFSQNLGRLSECVAVAMETGHRNACVLPDVFHLYKGGSDLRGIRLLGSEAIQVLHMNDYPNDPPRDKIDDSFRQYPGDGVAPLSDLLQTLRRTGGRKVLSLELFNRKYWSEDALAVAKTGLARMKAVVDKTPL